MTDKSFVTRRKLGRLELSAQKPDSYGQMQTYTDRCRHILTDADIIDGSAGRTRTDENSCLSDLDSY